MSERRVLIWFSCIAALVVAAFASSAPVRADAPAPVFGLVDQRVVFGDLAVGFKLGHRPEATGDTRRDIELTVSPGLLRFFVRNLAFGFSLDTFYADYQLQLAPSHEGQLGASLGAGLNLALAGTFSIFPRLWFGGGWMTRTERPLSPAALLGAAAQRTASGAYVSGELQIPLHMQLSPTTYLELGPFASQRLAFSKGLNRFRLGLSIVVGRVF